MKQWLKKRKGRGFTLVELLIVIVIIGILAGSLLLVMGSGTDKANATKVVSDMRTLKAASLMYYADKGNWPPDGDITDPTELASYLDRIPSSTLGDYAVSVTSEDGVFISFTPTASGGFITQLDNMKGEVGIEQSGDSPYLMRVARE